MSGTLTNNGFASAPIKSNQPILVDKSQSGKRQSRKTMGHLWSAVCTYPPMTKADFMPVWAFALSQQGESFTVTFPHLTKLGTATGTPVINNERGYVAGDSSINIDGLNVGDAAAIKSGDYFNIANHSKVYMFTADGASGAIEYLELESSTDTLEFESSTVQLSVESENQVSAISFIPDLIADVPDNTSIALNNVPFTMYFKNNVQQFKTSAPLIMRFELDLEESI